MIRTLTAALAATTIGIGAMSAEGASLRIGLQDDPDALDPATGSFFVGRVVFAALCNKLIDIDAKLGFVPQLATAWRRSASSWRASTATGTPARSTSARSTTRSSPTARCVSPICGPASST